MKVGIIGGGAVGTACLSALVARGVAREVVVLDQDKKRAVGLVTDVQYGAALYRPVAIGAGDYADLTGAKLIMITAGVNEKHGGATDRNDPQGRLRLLHTNVEVYKEIVPQLRRAAPEAVVLVVTDPPDPLADAVRRLGHERVLSTGTWLDSLRFRYHIAHRLGVSPTSVEAQILGEHGTSEVFVWSSARVAGIPVRRLLAKDTRDPEALVAAIEKDVRYANISIIEGIGASQHGIGMVCAEIAEIVLRDERLVVPIGSYHPHYRVTLSLPSIVGAAGVLQVLEPDLSPGETQALDRSAETLRSAVAQMPL